MNMREENDFVMQEQYEATIIINSLISVNEVSGES